MCPSLRAQAGEDLLKFADEVLAVVVKLRELEAKTSIEKQIKSRDEIKAYLTEKMRQEYPPEEIALEERALVKLGVIPKGLNLQGFMLELLTEQVAGFYDPRAKLLYIADWIPLEGQKPVMAHELLHALQDQHFNLSDFIKRTKGNDDAAAARHAVAEGEGLAIMLDYILKPMGQDFLALPNLIELQRAQLPALQRQYEVFATAPQYLRDWLFFPYTYGMNFMQVYRGRHTWAEVAKLYADPPRSTEQIIHPEKYLAERDEPAVLKRGNRPFELRRFGKRIYANVLGEFGTYLLLKEFIDESTAQRGAEGWDGDTLELYESRSGKLALVLNSVWDSEKDAVEFLDAYRKVVEKKYPQASLQRMDPKRLIWRSGTDTIYLKMQGTRIQVMELEM